jgi:hypothetical protein
MKEDQTEGHVACMVEIRNAYRILVGNVTGRHRLENLGAYGKVILK